MHVETYPTFLTPRDEEPSLSSSEEKSSEFDWLERKLRRKQKYEGKTKQVVCKIYFSLFADYILIFCKENYKLYISLGSLFSGTINFLYSLKGSKIQSFALPYLLNLIAFSF